MRQVGAVRLYIRVLRINVGAHGEELVDEVEIANLRQKVEDGPPVLRWEGGGTEAGGVALTAVRLGSSANNVTWRSFVCMPDHTSSGMRCGSLRRVRAAG
jgi:hypothetical protein